MSDDMIRGVIVPVLTPFNPDETVDVESLKKLVDYLIDNGVHGIWASGTTGEFGNMSDSERIKVIDTVVEQVNGRVPVIGNVSGGSTQLTVSLAQQASESGLDGIAATPPYYYPNAQDELLDHYRYIQDRVSLPLWVYNIPQTVKTAVAPETIATLAAEGSVVGVKDSSGAGELLAQLNVLCEQGEISLLRFLGTAFRVTSAGAVGAQGVIPGIANLIPAICAQGWEAGEAGDADGIREANAGVIVAGKASRIAQGGSANAAAFGAMKASLKIMGILEHDTLSKPFRPLANEEKEQLPPILKELGLLN